MNKMQRKIEITPQGQLILGIAVIFGLLGINFGFPFLWMPSFALILYYLPFIRLAVTKWQISMVEVFSATTITLGGFVQCRVKITNLQDNQIGLQLEFPVTNPIILVEGSRHQIVTLKPHESKEISFIFSFSERGVYEFPPLLIYRGDPLGFYQDAIILEEKPFQIRVIPARPFIRLSRKQKKDIRDVIAGYHAYRRKGQGEEFFSLREYIRGDEPRKIYWKGSARRGELVSKEFTDEVVFKILVAIDISWTMRSKKLEYALTSLLEIAEMTAQNFDSFGFILFDESPQKYLKPLKSPRLYEKTAKIIFDQKTSKTQASLKSIIPFIFSLKGTKRILIIISDSEGILEEKIVSLNKLAKFGHRIIFCDLRSDHFEIAQSGISIEHLNTLEKLKYLNIVRRRAAIKYQTREEKIQETLKNINGKYIRIDSVYQNLLLLLEQEFNKERSSLDRVLVGV